MCCILFRSSILCKEVYFKRFLQASFGMSNALPNSEGGGSLKQIKLRVLLEVQLGKYFETHK